MSRIDYTSPWIILGGLIAVAILVLAVPASIFLLPVVIVAFACLYFAAAGSMKRARERARSHLGLAGKSELEVELSLGLTSALVMNDWGVVFARFGRQPIELSWPEIRRVDEPQLGQLAFDTGSGLAFQADLSQERYLLAIRALDAKLPGKTTFDVDPATGQSNLLEKLKRGGFRWRTKSGQLALTEGGIENKSDRMTWDEIESVRGQSFGGDESQVYWELHFTSGERTIQVRSTDFKDGRPPGTSEYDRLKAIVAERLPSRCTFVLPPPLPRQRAIEEFNRCQEATKVGFSLALKSGKFAYCERQFRHMRWLIDTFSLAGAVDTETFDRDYAELLVRTERSEDGGSIA
jgi:hypothetical protein